MMTRFLRAFARITAPLARPLAGRRWFRLWAVVQHTGRSSGRAYATPVAVAPTADGFVIPVPFGDGTQWVRNVLAADGCTVRWNGRDYPTGDPTVIDRAAAEPAFNAFERAVVGAVGMDRFLRLRYRGS